MPKLRSLLFAGLGLAIAAALALVAFRTEPVPVDLHAVMRGPMEVTVHADGVAAVREPYDVAAPVSGVALRAPVRVGDRVVAGETVVAAIRPAAAPILDPRARAQAEAALREAQAALAAADAEIAAAEEEDAYAAGQEERITRLAERGLTPITALEDAHRRARAAAAGLEAAQSRRGMAEGAVARARAALEEPVARGACCHEIAAPVSGVVLRVDVLSERPVQAGAPLLAIGDPADLEIRADLLSSDAVGLPERAEARVERWGGPRVLHARLHRIDPVARTEVSSLGIEEQRVDAVFDLLDPPEYRLGLGDGYGVSLEIVAWAAEDVLRLPLAAAFRESDAWAVFVAEDGAARLRAVELGRIGDDAAEVTAGLEAGERVVLHPSDGVAEGVAIAPRGTP
ncbi:efflux RND transporter periplasmic adaptor subunit [Jannaschia formosa]|uniref:efflux RND transporter periplasmic adaptor subunit n=1 Tax=Jannaschia formosa TaxID=2259592 RepID=UPI000E1C07B6|nr:HlyD family efflux transporter periplasmic adaptor subunit [Jannaschia formosa]TFL16380.1 HlyD family efflux transporter periplasmic adaptor subunit [Jannaschia formosa]